MATLSTHTRSAPIKMLLIGDSGSGKTGALASLAADYNLRILDYDDGLEILAQLLANSPSAGKVKYQTLTDKFKMAGNSLVPDGLPQTWPRTLKLLTNWQAENETLGPVSSWTKKEILVLDSLTLLCKAVFRYVDVVNHFKDPRQTYGEAMRLIETLLGMLYSTEIKCNIIVTSHITFIETDSGFNRGYPSSIGKALSPTIPRYFNTVLEAKTVGTGASAKHKILTMPDGMIELKNPMAPGALPPELPLETGLRDFFAKMRGTEKPSAS